MNQTRAVVVHPHHGRSVPSHQGQRSLQMQQELNSFRLTAMESECTPEPSFSSPPVCTQVDDLGWFHRFQV